MLEKSDFVIEAEGPLDPAPPRHKRQIVNVDLERVNHRRIRVHLKECQHCKDAVELLDPHAWAAVWANTRLYRLLFKPVFCDRWCWIEWLRNAETPEEYSDERL